MRAQQFCTKAEKKAAALTKYTSFGTSWYNSVAASVSLLRESCERSTWPVPAKITLASLQVRTLLRTYDSRVETSWQRSLRVRMYTYTTQTRADRNPPSSSSDGGLLRGLSLEFSKGCCSAPFTATKRCCSLELRLMTAWLRGLAVKL